MFFAEIILMEHRKGIEFRIKIIKGNIKMLLVVSFQTSSTEM